MARTLRKNNVLILDIEAETTPQHRHHHYKMPHTPYTERIFHRRTLHRNGGSRRTQKSKNKRRI